MNSRFLALSDADRAKLEATAAKFKEETGRKTQFASLRDLTCLSNQYLLVQMQKPDWTGETVADFIEKTCVVLDKVYRYAMVECRQTYTDEDKNKLGFCACFADHYSKTFVSDVNDTSAYLSQLAVDTYGVCAKQ